MPPSNVNGARSVRLAIDVGGTFTDVAILDEVEGHVRFDKVSTTPADPAIGVMNAFAKAGVDVSDISYFVHGTTLAVNSLIARTGSPPALVTTLGFRDVNELGRTDREPMYDLTYRKPRALVPRHLAFEVSERLDFEGNVVTPFDRAQATRVAEEIHAAGVPSAAVCFLHSYANPAHELLMGEVLREVCPELEVTLSHKLVREYREYERTSTAVIDAYIKPIVRRYLKHLRSVLATAGFGGHFLITRSGGGAMTIETAAEQPAHLVLSGPAAGVIGAAAFAVIVDQPNLVTIDIGGTSLDASLVVGGAPTTVSEASFEGLAVALPSLNIKSIGAGGGSVAWIDSAGHMQVGPHSAGAVPGPASYAHGGTDATVTDAALVIGYLGEQTSLGGELTLVRELADGAIGRLAALLRLSPNLVANGILDIVSTRVTGTVREIILGQGHHPADFALLAFGGGGGLLAAEVAREVGIPRVIVPPGAGAFSAFGMLLTDVVHDFAQTRVIELGRLEPGSLQEVYEDLEARAREALTADGFGSSDWTLLRTAELRFAGQEHTVAISVPGGVLTQDVLDSFSEVFARAHEERYGHRMNDPVDLVTARLRAIGRVPRPDLPLAGRGDADRVRTGSRLVFRGRGDPTEYSIFWREALGRGQVIEGPAIVEEHTATTVVGPGDRLEVGDHAELIIVLGSERVRSSDSAKKRI
jgi:N-methylhydantoinase A